MNFVTLASHKLIDFTIALLRKVFRNTKIQSWRITGNTYSLVMSFRTKSRRNKDFFVVFRGAKFFCESGDITILPTLISGKYENVEINRLLEFASMREKRFKLIDVGANIGIYSILFAKEVNRNSDAQFFFEKQNCTEEGLREPTVFAFEPDPRNLARLYRNIQLNVEAPELIFVSELGVSDKQGRLEFKSSKYGGTSGIDILEYDSNIEIKVTTIDKFCENEVDSAENFILKIDVEGHESSVLRGALGLIKAKRPVIFVEVSPHSMNLEVDLMDEILLFYNRAEYVSGNKIQKFDSLSTYQLQKFKQYGNLILYNE